MAWYSNRFRRNLVDMHISDWDERFLSRFDPETYVENLKRAHIDAPMLYFQSHLGLCYFPTRVGATHNSPAGRGGLVKRVEQLCHAAGMTVVGYYSLVYNNWAHEHHPEWRMLDIDGRDSRASGSRYGLCCPNSEGYRAFTEAQIREFCDTFDFEGVFFDMLFWPMICYCPSCRARWAREVGGEMPRTVDWKDERWRLFQRKRTEWMGEFGFWAADTLHKYRPDASVENQYSTIMHDWKFGVNENMGLSSTYSGGDLYGGLAEQSFACKLYRGATRAQPFEYMTSRCYPGLLEHTTTKSEDMLRLSVLTTVAHHGASLLIDAIDPVGTLDERVYERYGRVFEGAMPYEKAMTTGEQAYDVALYYDLNGKYDPEAAPFDVRDEAKGSHDKPMHEALLGAARALQSHHILYGVVNNCWFDRFREAKVLALCDVPDLEEDKIPQILDYVRGGGSLYMSGHCAPKLMDELFGLRLTGLTPENITYISPTAAGGEVMCGHFTREYPLTMLEPAFLAEGAPKGEVWGTLTLPYTIPARDPAGLTPEQIERMRAFAAIHSNPPGEFTDRPALVYVRYGRGQAVWSAAPIERAVREQHSDIFAAIMKRLTGGVRLEASAPDCVEFVLFDAPAQGTKLLSVINLQEGFHALPVYDVTVRLKTARPPRAVRLVDTEQSVPYEWKDGMTVLRFDRIMYFEMVRVEE